MALVFKDRVQETSSTTGTGTLTLGGAVSGYQTFSSAIGNTNTTYYAIVNDSEWEVGLGTVSAGQLSRDTVLESSNANNLVNFSAGTKYVFCTYAADKTVIQDASNKVSGYAIENSTIGATTPSTGNFTSVTTPSVTASAGDLNLTPIGGGQLYLNQAQTGAFGTVIAKDVGNPASSARLFFDSSAGVSSIRNNNGNELRFATAATIGSSSGTTQALIAHTASAVNFVQVTGAATGVGNFPTISSQGSDANVNLRLSAKGSASIDFQIGGTTRSSIDNSGTFRAGIAANGTAGFQVSVTGSQVNFFSTTGTVTGLVPSLSATGTDTNISMAFQPKGTGAIDLAAGSSGVNISNGGTVTAITRTAAGSAYTTPPTVAISAPTTAGGVQATASANMFFTTATIVSGGTGYTVGDVLTFSGGTFVAAAQVTVATVSSGVITSVTGTTSGLYSVTPANPVSVTGGSGTGATFTVNYAVNTFTITNAGSGYIEQPTVTFSGGGGSGAAAYASVGSPAVFKGLAGSGSSSFSFFSPAGEALRIHDVGGSAVNYLRVQGGVAGNTPVLLAAGSDGSVTLALRTQGTGSVSFQTGGVTQAVVSHTASAVNYVQVTGAVTGGRPTISAQGSDGTVGLSFVAKGSALHAFGNGEGTQFAINTTGATIANRLNVAASAAGQAPSFSASGTDTDIDILLTPKGTGNVRFGTYTASMALTVQGYIEIKDSGGTIRKLAVIA